MSEAIVEPNEPDVCGEEEEGGVAFLMPLLICIVTFLAIILTNRYLVETSWIANTLGVIALIGLAGVWYFSGSLIGTIVFFGIVQFGVSFLPMPDKITKIWQERLDNPAVGDVYLIDTNEYFKVALEKRDQHGFTFFKISEINEDTLVFQFSKKKRSLEGVEKVLDGDGVASLTFIDRTEIIKRSEVDWLFDKKVIAGVYRPEG